MNEIYIFNAAKLAVKSVINVAAAYPKPGLITPLNNDALDGTGWQCFMDGAMNMLQCCVNCASAGSETQGLSPEDALTILQSPAQIGVNDVLRSTRGRLSLKGYVFELGLLCAAAGKLIAQRRMLTPKALALTASSYVSGICERELWVLTEPGRQATTDSQKAYVSYGLEGLRGEADHGFRLTLRAAEMLRKLQATQSQTTLRERCIHALLDIMSVNDDTCIAAHGGISELMRVRKESESVMKLGGMLTPEGLKAILDMDKSLRSRGVSPRGSAVIVSGALFIMELGNMKLTRSGYDE